MTRISFILVAMLVYSEKTSSQVDQVVIPRVDLMPDLPQPMQIRDWKEVAILYDSLVYDLMATGELLPLVFIQNEGINYPEMPSFGLHSYVGTVNPQNGEAINVLPSLVGASLAGVDKSDQYGRNWVLMSQDYFNQDNGELIYLNGPRTSSGGDWWYETMPNVFFYQLYDLYPDMGIAADQFKIVAARFAEAVRAMGAHDAPWTLPNMNYRAWDFTEMEPNPGGVIEPEAAGAFGWILYHAYKKTSNPEYLKAAEWSLEFLSNLNSNPSYELQLPYGTLISAKMNAEIGTEYDIEKLINWSFDRGPLRGWGTIVGNWGGIDVSGLVGEANDAGNDYAFLLNGVQQAAALVPAVRYDKRFATGIAKWVLNLTNATRFFYSSFLPPSLQDGTNWSQQYDPDAVIGHEAMREVFEGFEPFATGDAIRGGWAATNFALYGSSSIGYLGAIVQTTNVEGILKLDLLATDFFHEQAYPTYLLYNPHTTEMNVSLQLGEEAVDLFEMLSEKFIALNQVGQYELQILPRTAVCIVQAPAGGQISFETNRMLIDGVVVDYMQSGQPIRYTPRIQALAAASFEVLMSDTITLYSKVLDRDSEDITYTWTAESGTIIGDGNEVQWVSPADTGTSIINLSVSDGDGLSDSASLLLSVVEVKNFAPVITAILSDQPYTSPGGMLTLQCLADDPNGDSLAYQWDVTGGAIMGDGAEVTWQSPAEEGVYTVNVRVDDLKGGISESRLQLFVRVFADADGELIASYPFDDGPGDVSGNELHGVVFGARRTERPGDNDFSAYFFDGVNDNIIIPNQPVLNFQEGITLSLWFSMDVVKANEVFLVSHGSWQNRWKLSITPEQKLRWTINTTAGPISDLDSEVTITTDSFYHVAATFDGSWMTLYLNGELHAAKSFSGTMRATDIDLTIGQMLPDNIDYNFRGIIDQVNIYDHALIPDQVREDFEGGLVTSARANGWPGGDDRLDIFPNPVQDILTVRWDDEFLPLSYTIYSITGKVALQGSGSEGGSTGSMQIPLHILPEGLYGLIMKSKDRSRAIKFLKLE